MSRFCSKSAGTSLRRQLYVAVLAALSGSAYAVPEGGRVTVGAADIIANGDTLTIKQSTQRAVIEFDRFNIGAHETVNFVQPASDSVALNRALGSDLSAIHGTINANGQVYLINPNGVLFGAGAQVNVGGLVATTLDMSDRDFINRHEQLQGVAQGLVENRGKINASSRVALIAPDVVNSGDINVPGGEIMLRSSRSVLLHTPGSEIPILMEDPQLSGQAMNEGTISGGRVAMVLDGQGSRNVYDNAINNSGIVRAVTATGEGGTVELLASGGDVVVSGEINASAEHGRGGDIMVRAQRYGQSGAIEAVGKGLGDGGDVAINTDQTIAMTATSKINASGAERGNGGEVILYAENDTWFDEGAEITARGGDHIGDGGFVEVSGRAFVNVFGTVDVGAANGEGGLWYIDPTNIDITTGSSNSGTFVGPDPFNWDGSGVTGTAQIGVLAIRSALMNGSVIIDTASAQADAGDINFRTYLNFNDLPAGRTLWLNADRDIIFQGGSGVEDASPGGDELNVSLNAGRDIMFNGSTSIDVGTGTFAARAGGSISVTNITSASTSGQAILLQATGGALNATNTAASVNAANGGVVLGAATGINLFSYVNSQGLGLRHYGAGPFDYDHSGDLVLTSLGLGADSVFNISATGSITYTGTGGGDLDGATNATLSLTAGTSLAINGDLADITGEVDNTTTLNFSAGTGFSMSDGVAINSGGGLIDISTTAGNAEVSGLVSTSSAANAIRITTGGALLGVGGNSVSLSAVNGGLVVNAVDGVADIETHVAQVDITASMGDITFTEVDDVEVVRLSAGNAVNVTTGGDFVMPGTAGLVANQLSVNSGGRIILPDAGLNLAAALSLSGTDIVAETVGGTLDLTAATIELVSLVAGGDSAFNATAGTLAVTNNGTNNMSVSSTSDFLTVANNGSGELSVTDTDALTLSSAAPVSGTTRVSTADSFDLTIADANTIDLAGAGGRLALHSGNDLLVNVDIVDASGPVDGSPTLLLSATNNVTFGSSVSVDVGAGDLSVSALRGNVSLGWLTGNSVDISAGAAIIDANAGTTNVAATTATLTAGGDVGTSLDALDGDVGAMTVSGGSVYFSNARAMSLGVTGAANLEVALPSAGDLTLLDTGSAITGNGRFNIAEGDLVVADGGLSLMGDLTVTAHTIRAVNAATSLQAANADITLTAGGADTVLNVDFSDLVLQIASNQTVTVNDVDELTVSSVTTGGDLTLTAGGDLLIKQLRTGGNLSVNVLNNLILTEATPAVGGDLALMVGDTVTVADQGLQVNGGLSVDAGSVASASAIGATVWQADSADIRIRDSAQSDGLDALVKQLSVRYDGRVPLAVSVQDGAAIRGLTSSADLRVRSAGQLQMLTESTAVNGLLTLEAGGALELANNGLAVMDAVQIAASNLMSSSGGAVALSGNHALIALTGEAPLSLNTRLAQLGLDYASAENLEVVNDGDLQIGSWQIGNANDVGLSVSGTLTVPTSGLDVPGRLRIEALDLLDTDRTVSFSAPQLLVKLADSRDSNVWHFTGQQLDAQLSGPASLQIAASNGIALQDLDGDGQAINISNGNFSVALGSGDLLVNSDVFASDLSANGTRQGVIDLHAARGNISVGLAGDVAIVSNNSVDTGAASAAGDQNGIRLQLGDTSSANRQILLGSGTTNVSLQAVGGDIALNARPVGTDAAARRSIVQSAGATIAAYNKLSDTRTGRLLVNGAEQQAQPWQQIHQGRTLTLVTDLSVGPDFGDVLDELDKVGDRAVIKDEPKEPGANASEQFDAVFGRCDELDQNGSQRCRLDTALKAFLSHWLVGGEMPPKSEI